MLHFTLPATGWLVIQDFPHRQINWRFNKVHSLSGDIVYKTLQLRLKLAWVMFSRMEAKRQWQSRVKYQTLLWVALIFVKRWVVGWFQA